MAAPTRADPPKVVVGVLADPDLPAAIADRLATRLPRLLGARINSEVRWTVETVCDPFEAFSPSANSVLDKARDRVRDTGWDLAICLTDTPLRGGSGTIAAEVSLENRVALISLPALGGLCLSRRVSDLALVLIAQLTERGPDLARATAALGQRWRAIRDDTHGELVVAHRHALVRLLAGMVRANRPWQLVLGLSRALAGALTGSAFGVLYSNIWALTASLQPWRLAAMALGAIAILIVWIIVAHDLWESDPGAGAACPEGSTSRLNNAATVLTVTLGAVAFFTALFVLNVAAIAVVVPPPYLGAVLARPARVADYPALALMATILGTVAGAVGSGLEDDLTVRRATYGHRQHERWRHVRRQHER